MMQLSNLPRELLADIESYLDDDDCKQLCQTCRPLMHALQERVYRHIALDETKESGQSFLAIATGPRAQYVRRVRYSPHEPKPVKGWDEDSYTPEDERHDPNIKLSDEGRDALASLHRFPGLEELALVLDDWQLVDWPGTPFSLSGGEFEEYHDGYDVEPWRVLLEDSFLALGRSGGTFTRMLIDNLPPIPETPCYHAIRTEEWKTILNGLTSFEVILSSIEDQGAGSMTIAHSEFLDSFTETFLCHLKNVERLRIVGDGNAVIGHLEDREPIPWTTVHLPRIKTFELEYSCFSTTTRGNSSELVDFLLQHSGTLERIYLRHCIANGISAWSDLIQGFIAARPTQLRDFIIEAYPMKMNYWIDDDEQVETGEETKMRQFVIGETCESYGAIQPFWMGSEPDDEQLEELDESEVAEQWKVLQNIIQENRSTG